MHKSRGEKKQGRKNLEEALRWARKAAELKGDSAKVHALLADLWGERLVAYGGFLAGPKFGPKVKDENQKAVSLSPNDPVVLASLGRQYLLSPKAFGGDVPKAIDLFKRSLALDPSSDATYVWLARAYKKQKDRPNFLAALGMALRLRPENAQARWELEGWPEDAPPSDKSEQKEGVRRAEKIHVWGGPGRFDGGHVAGGQGPRSAFGRRSRWSERRNAPLTAGA
jgi:tetratricopeptide (TPR) repeat protein